MRRPIDGVANAACIPPMRLPALTGPAGAFNNPGPWLEALRRQRPHTGSRGASALFAENPRPLRCRCAL